MRMPQVKGWCDARFRAVTASLPVGCLPGLAWTSLAALQRCTASWPTRCQPSTGGGCHWVRAGAPQVTAVEHLTGTLASRSKCSVDHHSLLPGCDAVAVQGVLASAQTAVCGVCVCSSTFAESAVVHRATRCVPISATQPACKRCGMETFTHARVSGVRAPAPRVRYRFVVFRPTGAVVSEKALKEVPTVVKELFGRAWQEEDLVHINPTGELTQLPSEAQHLVCMRTSLLLSCSSGSSNPSQP